MDFLEKNRGFFLHERNNLVIFEVVATNFFKSSMVYFLILYSAGAGGTGENR